MKILYDTSVLIAALLVEHANHDLAFPQVELVFCQLINDELLEYNLEEVRSLKIDAQEIYC
jgi:predicted nucleic acid-binding protein